MERGSSHIKDITKAVYGRLKRDRATKEERAKRAWEKAAGRRFGRHTQPVSFRRRRLVVNVDSSGWLYELTLSRRKIVATLKKALKEDFGELRFRIGDIEKREIDKEK